MFSKTTFIAFSAAWFYVSLFFLYLWSGHIEKHWQLTLTLHWSLRPLSCWRSVLVFQDPSLQLWSLKLVSDQQASALLWVTLIEHSTSLLNIYADFLHANTRIYIIWCLNFHWLCSYICVFLSSDVFHPFKHGPEDWCERSVFIVSWCRTGSRFHSPPLSGRL